MKRFDLIILLIAGFYALRDNSGTYRKAKKTYRASKRGYRSGRNKYKDYKEKKKWKGYSY